ncbi:unnamed protein product [Danaus chrysippus]|uniref:(African queen) hypothetical protein n=1 Tax=Danaus chrysippus TaxID=151541 RepID=A0A8J2QFB2_9NEOP|nr:unnamed protein product [Danaus chrysippus]
MKDPQVEYKPRETWRIMKNAIIISIAFMVHFTAYSGAANLQSSINAESGLGTVSLAAVYAGLIFSNIFLPVVIIKWLGTKWAISLSFITYMPYIAAQLYPTFYTLIPAALIVGLGGGPLWCAKCTYLSVVMISSGDNVAAVTTVNDSFIPQLCGANFLPTKDAGQALQQQPPEKIQMIAGIYLACMAGAALIVAIGVDSMKRYKTSRSETGSSLTGMALLAVTVKLLVEPNQLMLVIINIFVGMQQAFFGADFTAAFVSCAVGTGTVGFVMMAYGLADAIGCVVTGYLAKLTGRMPMIGMATVLHSLLLISLLAWSPQQHQLYIMYIIAILWGFCDSIWLVQINAYYGILFKGREEAAFSNFRLWESVGYIIAYIISPFLRTSIKTYILIIAMVVGVVFYFIVEYRDRKAKRLIEIEEKKTRKAKYLAGQENTAYIQGE